MPRVPQVAAQPTAIVPDELLLMAAADMHSRGRLVEPPLPMGTLEEKEPDDMQRQADLIEAARNQRLDEKYPHLRNRMRGR